MNSYDRISGIRSQIDGLLNEVWKVAFDACEKRDELLDDLDNMRLRLCRLRGSINAETGIARKERDAWRELCGRWVEWGKDTKRYKEAASNEHGFELWEYDIPPEKPEGV